LTELTQEQIDFYHENGYLALDTLVSEQELEIMRAAYDRIFSERAGRDVGDQFDLAGTDEEGKEPALPQILGPSKYAPELAQGEYRRSADRIVKQLLGDEAGIGGDHAILKPARHGAATPWHQDEAYWDPGYDYRSLSIWIPLQEATVENGCLQFVPGSHRLEVLEHQSVGGDVRIHALEVLNADTTNAVSCPITAGGCTIHDSKTLHYAGPNNTDEPRRALILGGGAPATERTDGRRFPWNERKRTARDERARRASD